MLFRLLLLAGLLLAMPGAAHDLEATVELAPPAVIVRAAYGGTEPIPFAKVQVYSPKSGPPEFQTGVTDRRGYFSFVPDGPGSWKVVVDDEEGHRREVEIAVPNPFRSPGIAGGGASRLERAGLGVALMIGATGILYGFKARGRSQPS